jgi:hypothetical protein
MDTKVTLSNKKQKRAPKKKQLKNKQIDDCEFNATGLIESNAEDVTTLVV